jgi:4-aminobutyrate aminotransferase/(S)-3-amino-2-methylpropionate transaminase
MTVMWGTKGPGKYVDVNGTEWDDMLSGILNVSLGHGSSIVTRALQEVAETGLINSYDRPCCNAGRLTDLLEAYDPRFRWKLLNTGSEAIERAIQICAVALGKRPRVAVLPHSFHGKSLSMSCSRYDVPWGNPMGIVKLDSCDQDFDVLIYEPIRGWDGVAEDEALLREHCNRHNAILIADEMITGFLRCGPRFMNRTADIVVSGKGLAQGAPLAVLGVRPELMPANMPIGWTTTGGGNNLSATIGLRVLQHLMKYEQIFQDSVRLIHSKLAPVCHRGAGALWFYDCINPSKMRKAFEDAHIVASWHGAMLRLGPRFAAEPELLERTIGIIGEVK